MEYNSCYTPGCPRREECTLWHNALQKIEENLIFIDVTNPKLIEKAGGYDLCPQFHRWELRRYARGMRWRYGMLSGDAQQAIHEELESHFGYALIGRMRRGDEVISPEDQAYIKDVFARYAEGVEPEFTDFEMHYVKPPRLR